MLRTETKARARALQLLYAWELQGAGAGPTMDEVATGLARLTGPEPELLDEAEALANAVVARRDHLDRLAADASDNWRLERVAAIERNILRIGIHLLERGDPPPKVVIDEALWLAHRFASPKAPGFINGVLDRVARNLGRL